MKTLAKFILIGAVLGTTFALGGAIVYFGDAWYFKEHTGGTPISDVYKYERICEERFKESCSLSGMLYPDSYFREPVFDMDKGI